MQIHQMNIDDLRMLSQLPEYGPGQALLKLLSSRIDDLEDKINAETRRSTDANNKKILEMVRERALLMEIAGYPDKAKELVH